MATLHQSTLSELDPNFPLAEAAPQMQVRKRNGASSRSTSTRSSAPCSAAATACRTSTPSASPARPSAASSTAPPRASSTPSPSRPPRRSSPRSREYSRLAARLLLATIVKEVAGQNIYSFSQSIEIGHREGVVSARQPRSSSQANARKLNSRHRRPLLRPLRVLRPAHRL